LIGWGRKRSRRWVALVLPGLLLRVLIPVGFMPMFGPGLSVQLMLCEGYAPVPSTAAQMSTDMSMDMPMDMPMRVPAHDLTGTAGSTGGGVPSHQDHSSCPYGASPAIAALPALTHVPISLEPTAQSPLRAAQVAHLEIAPRAQSPRGPPLQV
jgi:hypothetical protein